MKDPLKSRQNAPSLALAAIGAVILAWAPAAATGQDGSRGPVKVTPHFAFYSDFAANLNDALIAAGLARKGGKPEPFAEPGAAACLAALPPAERAGWNRAVDYYADVVSSASASGPAQALVRLELSGVVKDEEWEKPEEHRFIEITRAMRAAAAPAYTACRWTEQDRANRRWIEALAPWLAEHESALAGRLAAAFQTPWTGLPFRVDVVETVEWSGANTFLLRPPLAAHILISSAHPGYQGTAALEMVFHEASHFLTGRDTPIRGVFEDAVREAGSNPFRGDLIHAVHFYMTGEIVRRRLQEAAAIDYKSFIDAQGLYARGDFRQAIEATWPAYLDGKVTLPEAARALVRALQTGARLNGRSRS